MIWQAIWLLGCLHIVSSSYGDTTHEYNYCVEERCVPSCDYTTFPLHIKLLGWNCLSNCRYTCQQDISQRRIELGKPILQYHGKWPFLRMFGLQEPASVLFSIGNAFAVFYGINQLVTKVPSSYPLYKLWYVYGWISLGTWIVSTLFHAKDNAMTETFDYLGATTMVMMSLYCMLVRISGRDQFGKIKSQSQMYYGVPIFMLFLYHSYYMILSPRIDYGYNMKFTIFIAVIHHSLLLGWGIWNFNTRPHIKKAVWVILGTTAAVLLELGDFSPIWGVFDAHALWHAATMPLTALWWSFIVDDCVFESNRFKRKVV